VLPVARADVDPAAVQITAPSDLKWVKNAAGTNETAVLFGDPSKPGPYVMRIKWLPGNMSRPHTHTTDRFFVVISGTWWCGSGTKFDPASTVPAKPGSYVIHHAGQPHYDGAKGEETVIQVFGVGPLTTEQVEVK
jgi:quercetin dioxygenase-like cupin family protein